jgi:hypothetical protein
MRIDLKKTFKYYFPSSYEMYMTGGVLLIFSLPGVGFIFFHHDIVFPDLISGLRVVAIVWGCVMSTIAILLIFFAIRGSASVGTATYRLTHPRLFARRR